MQIHSKADFAPATKRLEETMIMSHEIETIPVTEYQQNCRVISNRTTLKALVIDPGGDLQKVSQFVKKKGLAVEAILLTHGHIDHAGAAEDLHQSWGVPIYAHRGDEFLLFNLEDHAKFFGSRAKNVQKIDHCLQDGETLDLIDLKIKVLHAPGHSPGSCCFLFRLSKWMVAVGDVLFAGSIGRTDLWGGNHNTLIQSIEEKLLVLSDDTIVMSGHGPDTTIGVEKRSNPFLQ